MEVRRQIYDALSQIYYEQSIVGNPMTKTEMKEELFNFLDEFFELTDSIIDDEYPKDEKEPLFKV